MVPAVQRPIIKSLAQQVASDADVHASVTQRGAGRRVPSIQASTSRRRVLLITYDFPPSIRMGAHACAQLARYLPLYGWDPVVLTVRERHIEDCAPVAEPAFPGCIIRTGLMPHPFSVYRRLKPPRARNGSRGHSTNGSPERADGLRHWLTSLLWIPDPHTGWVLPAVVAGLRAVRAHRIDHLLSSSPASTNHLVGLLLARLTGLPWTAQFRDPWVYPPEQWHLAKPVSTLSRRIETGLERLVVRRAEHVVSVTDRHVRWLRQVHPTVPSAKFVAIPNGFDGAEWEALERETEGARLGRNETFVITYAGSLYRLRSPRPLFRALRSLIDAGEVLPERIRVDLLGYADADGVADLAASCGVASSVAITGHLTRREAIRRVARSDLLLLLAEQLTLQIPGKTYEYLRSGRPILALTSGGAVADLLRQIGGAYVVDPDDATGISAAVRDAYRRWCVGRPACRPDPEVVAGFDRRLLAGRLAELWNAGTRLE